MPKENVNCESGSALRAELGWTPGTDDRDGHVQLATTNPQSPIHVPARQGDGEDAMPAHDHVGWFVTLDREGINRLIRALRRARDSAFGADA